MEARDKIIAALKKVTGQKEILLETPVDEKHGDFSTNIALKINSAARSSLLRGDRKSGPASRETAGVQNRAQKIVEKLLKDNSLKQFVSKIEVAGPGFINFWLSPEYLLQEVKKAIVKKENYGRSDILNSKKIMFEYGDANTHKLPHVGHLFSYIYGESASRILEFAGAQLQKACYQGDIGLHVAKCLWAWQKNKPSPPKSLTEKIQLLQKMYQTGSKAYTESETSEKEIDDLNKALYDKSSAVFGLWQKTRKWNIDFYKEFEKRLGIKYDRYYYESEVGERGKEIVKENTPSVFQKSRGAYIFPGSRYGLHERVFVTSHDTPTYEAKDMALQELKIKEWPADLLIISTANEQNEYFKVIFKALEQLSSKFVGKLKHLGFGMINLKSGKMSSRTGEIVGGVELLEEVVGKVRKLSKDALTAEKVGIGAVKYSFLKNNYLQDTKFDIKESIAKEGNSGPYLQYTVARTNSVLRKAKKSKAWLLGLESSEIKNLKPNREETSLLRSFAQFQGVIADAANNYSPNLLCEFLFTLAQKYNSFYNQHTIIGSENEKLRLALTAATSQILKNGLMLLGIETPEQM